MLQQCFRDEGDNGVVNGGIDCVADGPRARPDWGAELSCDLVGFARADGAEEPANGAIQSYSQSD